MKNERVIINDVAARYQVLPADTGRALLSDVRAMSPVYMREELPGVSHATMRLPQLDARRNFSAITIPAGRYLVMGDNRDNSHDSRYFGLVRREAILGRAMRVVVSLDPENHYLPRRGRWLEPAL